MKNNTPPMKLRRDAWYSALPEEALWAIYDKAKRLPWQEVATWAAKEYNLPEAPRRTAYYDFVQRMSIEARATLVGSAARARRLAEALAQRYGGDADMADALKAYGAAIIEDTGDPEAAESFFRIAAKLSDAADKAARRRLAREERERAHKLAEERLKLDREKFEAAEKRLAAAAGTVQDSALTPEEQVKRMKEIFGIHG